MAELVRRSTAPITQKVSRNFSPEMAKVIRDTVAKDCTEPEFHLFLEVCARYELNPLVGEIWCAKMPGKNGAAGRVAFIVGRDGMLKVASRYDDFESVDGDVVRENDRFQVTRTGKGRVVDHSYMGSTTKRGPIVGAWAEVIRKGHAATYFYAPIEEYKPTSEGKLKFSPWGAQESAMMLKCAQSTALRFAYSITGLYSEGELSKAQALATQSNPEEEPRVEWGEDEEVAGRLQALVQAANGLKPGTYRPAKLQMLLNGKSDAERIEVAQQIERFIVANDGEIPEPPVDAEVVDAEPMADAA